jgi:hypothetical protein
VPDLSTLNFDRKAGWLAILDEVDIVTLIERTVGAGNIHWPTSSGPLTSGRCAKFTKKSAKSRPLHFRTQHFAARFAELLTDPYLWWIPHSGNGRFMTIGNLGQFIYVAPDKGCLLLRFGRAGLKDWQMVFVQLFNAIVERL